MNKTALITGTTSGIGYAFAEKMALNNYNLILVARNPDKLNMQKKYLIQKYNIDVHFVVQDLLQPKASEIIYNNVKNLELKVDILINNAGFNECGSFLETSIKNESNMIHLHAQHTTEMMKLFLPYMIKTGYGKILNVGSTGSFIPCPNDAVYAATKAYILSLSQAINSELKGTGVTVTALCPGSTRTEFATKAGMDNTLLFKLFVMDPNLVANIGYRAMLKGKEHAIPGIYNKLLVLSSKIIPPFLINPITKKMLSK